MPDPLRVTAAVVLDPADLAWRFSRAGGPGGQGVNTADSRVELSFDVARSAALSPAQRDRVRAVLASRLVGDVLTVVASEHRSQLQNRRAAQERLLALLRDALAPPPPPRRASRPSRGVRRRRAEDKQRRSATKELRRRPPD
ncbi:alternative ribosome rescue aminoacyl-tRNA hydrolase ArfB [Georgenia muralis]|uniref:Ribosome-associated protein n=1 Tax=Georgenia muralis TaxID=154117 RepID=A0A3N4ZSB8_9MICO|nr:alternative ribosome rescue aminoacyl-tRNA hydrolase ArfB [Georgenia muralis]RPF28382.1 ribosome-associated protein [Georgenia muralis]